MTGEEWVKKNVSFGASFGRAMAKHDGKEYMFESDGEMPDNSFRSCSTLMALAYEAGKKDGANE